MAAEPRHKSRKHQIEPLSWSEAAQSPALKGMLSFLDVSAADVRNGQNQNPDLHSSPKDNGINSNSPRKRIATCKRIVKSGHNTARDTCCPGS